MNVGVIGTGHVGLVTCVTMAALGHRVVGCDSDPEKMEQLQRSSAPFFEPGLQELLEETVSQGTLGFTSEPAEAIKEAVMRDVRRHIGEQTVYDDITLVVVKRM